jgi:hypothetical protein
MDSDICSVHGMGVTMFALILPCGGMLRVCPFCAGAWQDRLAIDVANGRVITCKGNGDTCAVGHEHPIMGQFAMVRGMN